MATLMLQMIFWATQVRSADLLSRIRMETQTILVALHAKLEKPNNSAETSDSSAVLACETQTDRSGCFTCDARKKAELCQFPTW